MIKRFLSAVALGLLMAVSLWLMGLIWFVTQMPSPNRLQVNYPADAIVVLTGGQGRIEYGLSLLQQGMGKQMLVSGVHQETDKTEIFSHFRRTRPAEYDRLQARIVLGKRALDTRGNALETAEWVKKNHFKSLHLVTANYHLPRSLVEFRRVLPQITLFPAPVYAEVFKSGQWWQDKPSLRLVLSEYHKTIASYVYGWVRS